MRSSTPLRVFGSGIDGSTIDFTSEDRRTEAMVVFVKFLLGAAIAYAILSILCIWEFTIGIKKSIKHLYRGHI
jgi:hypothetical protein